TPLPAITVCHDYSYYRVTGQNPEKDWLTPDGLRNALTKLKFKLVQDDASLRPGDVVIIGPMHSGFVNDQGGIDHYIQMREHPTETQSILTVVSPSEVELQPTFYRNWPLERILNFERTMTQTLNNITTTTTQKPFADKKVEVWRWMKLIILPQNKTLKQGETQMFEAKLTLKDGTVLDAPDGVSFSPAKEFKAEKTGTFKVTASYGGDETVASVTVVENKKECPENEAWDDETGKCECKPGFTRNKENVCVKIDAIIDELSEEETDDICSKKDIQNSTSRVNDLAAEVRANYTRFLGMAAKFNKETNDRAADPCRNGLAAYCYANAQEIAGAISETIAQIQEISTEIIVQLGICPDLVKSMREQGLGINNLVGSISGINAIGDDCASRLAQMRGRLGESGCDENEVIRLGQTIVPPGLDGDFLQDGGAMVEIPGDAVDNEADGLQDESLQGLAGYNLTAVLYDSGSAKDDSFNLAVSGYGNLGTTPRGGLRSYGFNLPPGTYTATVTVISAPDNYGTFTLVILENGVRIAAASGSPAEGASSSLSFTVTGH
ncbi:MAG: hypothetical protein NTW95_10455, partial [Candidatus Aminicenantes bacterium]|nr:hypothetical protein [Candidatus Aminicenantes bacterium]